jgi:hypothetical protein
MNSFLRKLIQFGIPFFLIALHTPSVSSRMVCKSPILKPINGSYDYCAFSAMPLFDQTNPNLAFINVPEASVGQTVNPTDSVCTVSYNHYHSEYPATYPTYNCEKSPAPDHYMENHQPQPNPYIKSWLPWGPFPGDSGSLPWKRKNMYGSATCGPTSETMALTAAIAYKDSSTQIVPNSWTDLNFSQAQKPAFQNDWPSPLVGASPSSDPNNGTSARSGYQMSQQELQRLVNLALLQETDPSYGGDCDAIESLTNDFTSPNDSSKVYEMYDAIDQGKSVNINNAHVVKLIKDGFVTLIAIHYYTVHIENVGGSPLHQQITLASQPGGHILAVEGYSQLNGQSFLIIHDPFYGIRRIESLPELNAGTVIGTLPSPSTSQAKVEAISNVSPPSPSDTTQAPPNRTLYLPPGLSSVMVVPWEPPYWDPASFPAPSSLPSDPPPPVNDIWGLQDKEIITVVDTLRGIYVP